MASFIKMSEAANLALHASALLASAPERRVPAKEMARRLGASEAHLAKVMQRLRRTGLVTSARGPTGGFSLARDAGKISLKEIYEAIEGRIDTGRCMFGEPVCGRRKCFLGGLVRDASRMIDSRLSGTKLSEAAIRLEEKR